MDDEGIGLTVDEVHQLLATIGSSSKRDSSSSPRRTSWAASASGCSPASSSATRSAS
ncbi:hypothetical protein [Blastococcus brunescens]|uniref:EF-hand domain-containing protein n=1 Tax=Blastococcus brunescens TaxID=1564165 RepID=A0ABZ1B5X2_9ACTN|nr:hypothetical protein [Blastococcus sp. BMG 8361]WRL65762.1 hypothetical protein U6N30_09375 [Blastococcus sp. BMG 8361]